MQNKPPFSHNTSFEEMIRKIKHAPASSSPHWLNRSFSVTFTIRQWVFVLFILLLVWLSGFFLGKSLVSASQSQVSQSVSPNTDTTSSQQYIVTQVPTDTPLPTPTPTPFPRPGDFLYQSSSDNWQGWGASDHWSVLNGQLLNDGNGYPLLIAPYHPGEQNIADYTVVAKITLITYNSIDHSSFGINVRGTPDNGGYSFSLCKQRGIVFGTLVPCAGHTINEALLLKGQNFPDGEPVLGHSTFIPDENREYTYRIEVKGYTISVFIDDKLLFPPQNDLTYPSGGSVGLWSVDCQISVKSLAIIAA